MKDDEPHADEPRHTGGLQQRDPGGGPESHDGVDVTLIRWMLSLTPAQRLGVLQANVRALWRLRHARRPGS